MRLEVSAFVEGDLHLIATTIAEDNPRRAVTFIQDIATTPIYDHRKTRSEDSPTFKVVY